MRTSVQLIALVLLIGLTLLFQDTRAQSPSPTPASDAVTVKERLELRAFTQDFLAKLKKTRDVRPLLSQYFANDFETLTFFYLAFDPYAKQPPLSRSERKRFAIAIVNFMYLLAPYTLELAKDFEKQLPVSLRGRFRSIEKRMDNADTIKTRRSILRLIPKIESFTDNLRRYSKRIESSEKYLANVRKREDLDDYNFRIIDEDPPDPDTNNPMERWILRRGPDARTSTVGTPYGIAVVTIRENGRYKVLFLCPWPISYDSRLN